MFTNPVVYNGLMFGLFFLLPYRTADCCCWALREQFKWFPKTGKKSQVRLHLKVMINYSEVMKCEPVHFLPSHWSWHWFSVTIKLCTTDRYFQREVNLTVIYINLATCWLQVVLHSNSILFQFPKFYINLKLKSVANAVKFTHIFFQWHTQYFSFKRDWNSHMFVFVLARRRCCRLPMRSLKVWTLWTNMVWCTEPSLHTTCSWTARYCVHQFDLFHVCLLFTGWISVQMKEY